MLDFERLPVRGLGVFETPGRFIRAADAELGCRAFTNAAVSRVGGSVGAGSLDSGESAKRQD